MSDVLLFKFGELLFTLFFHSLGKGVGEAFYLPRVLSAFVVGSVNYIGPFHGFNHFSQTNERSLVFSSTESALLLRTLSE